MIRLSIFKSPQKAIGLIKLLIAAFFLVNYLIGAYMLLDNANNTDVLILPILYFILFFIYCYYLLRSGYEDLIKKPKNRTGLRTYSIIFGGIMIPTFIGITISEFDEMSLIGSAIMISLTLSFGLIMLFDLRTFFDYK